MNHQRRHALIVTDSRSFGSYESRTVQRRWRVDPQLSSLPVCAVATLADGGSCRPRALRIGDREIGLTDSPWSPGWLVTRDPILLGPPGVDVCLSLDVHNEEYRRSHFIGALLLGDWIAAPFDADFGSSASSSCRDGGICRAPRSGGACRDCGYPRAYAHPSMILGAFLVDQIYVQGTAMQVYPDPGVSPAVVQVVYRDGLRCEYPIPPEHGEKGVSVEAVDRRLLHVAPRQLRAGSDSPAEAIGNSAQARLLDYASHLLLGSRPTDDARDLAVALAGSVAALSRGYDGYLDWQSFRVLERASSNEGGRRISTIASEVRTILAEVGHRGRASRLRSVFVDPRIVVDDRRVVSRPWASCASIGPFLDPLHRIRIALLPGEADHVRIYDLRVTGPGDDVGCSVLDRVPGYGPGAVREGVPVELGLELGASSRYLPGAMFAGLLREGVDLDFPYSLPGDALTGGVEIDLGRAFPPLSCVCVVYRIDHGHLLCAVVTPA